MMSLLYWSHRMDWRLSISLFFITPSEVNSSTFLASVHALMASGDATLFGSPSSCARLFHSGEYPLPLKMMRLCLVMMSVTVFWMASSSVMKLDCLWRMISSAMKRNESAMIVLITMLLRAALWFEPTARNSNLFTVKANGEVRLRSVPSRLMLGIEHTPRFRSAEPVELRDVVFFMNSSSAFVTSSPRYMEMIAGGASFAPRW